MVEKGHCAAHQPNTALTHIKHRRCGNMLWIYTFTVWALLSKKKKKTPSSKKNIIKISIIEQTHTNERTNAACVLNSSFGKSKISLITQIQSEAAATDVDSVCERAQFKIYPRIMYEKVKFDLTSNESYEYW